LTAATAAEVGQPSPLRWLWLSALVIVLDQATKAVATATLVLHEPVPVMPGFNWMLAHNLGIAFSLFNDGAGWQRWGLSGFAIVISAVLVRWLHKLAAHERISAVSLSLIIGGALGNVIDRLRLGYVVDFVEWYAGSYYWPAFNLADSCIVVGAGLLMIAGWRGEHAFGA